MTQRTDAYKTSRFASEFGASLHWRSSGHSLLVKSLSCVGGLGILSSGLVWAQTRIAPDTTATTTKGTKSTVAAPVKSVPNTSKPAMPTAVRAATTVTITAPVSVKQERTKPESTFSTPASSSDRVGSVVTPPKNIDRPTQVRPTVPLAKTPVTATDNNSAYIDPTNYSIGATGGNQTPSQVVLMERSTGCKAVLRSGQGMSSGNLCGAVAVPRSISQRQLQPVVPSSISQRQPQSAVPSLISGRSDENHPDLAAVPPRWTNRSRNVTTPDTPIPVGSISANTNGVASQPLPAAAPSPIALADVGNVILPRSVTLPPRSGLLEYQQLLRPNGQLIGGDNINTGMLFPLSTPAPITSIFGWRISPITGGGSFHAGTDLGAPIGTPVLAAYAGNVVVANSMGGYGLAVVLEHKNPFEQTLYGHLSQIFVQPGQWVEQGTAIGRVGSTGMSTGPHLHFEIRQMTPQGWVATDPGTQIQYAMTQLVQAVQIAQAPQEKPTAMAAAK